jgi:hypothetical protein
MNQNALAYAVTGFLVVGVFLAWFYSCWQNYVIESARQKLFSLRDSWFDLVTQNPEWRDHPSSRMFRMFFNAQIRWQHKFSLPLVVLVFALPQSKRGHSSYERFQAGIAHLPTENLRKEAKRLQEEAMLAVTIAMVQRSLVLLFFFIALTPLLAVGAIVSIVCRAVMRICFPTRRQTTFRTTTIRTLRPFAEVELSIVVDEDSVLPAYLNAA